MHRQGIARGRVSYEPNSLSGGCPFQAGAKGFVEQKSLTITGRWWIQLLGHIAYVGVPIVWGIGRGAPKPVVARS